MDAFNSKYSAEERVDLQSIAFLCCGMALALGVVFVVDLLIYLFGFLLAVFLSCRRSLRAWVVGMHIIIIRMEVEELLHAGIVIAIVVAVHLAVVVVTICIETLGLFFLLLVWSLLGASFPHLTVTSESLICLVILNALAIAQVVALLPDAVFEVAPVLVAPIQLHHEHDHWLGEDLVEVHLPHQVHQVRQEHHADCLGDVPLRLLASVVPLNDDIADAVVSHLLKDLIESVHVDGLHQVLVTGAV